MKLPTIEKDIMGYHMDPGGRWLIEWDLYFPRRPRFWGKASWFEFSARINNQSFGATVVFAGIGFWFEVGYGDE